MMTDIGMPLGIDLCVKLVSIFTTSGGSCVPWSLIITLLDLRTSLHIFTERIKLNTYVKTLGTWYPHCLSSPIT